MMTIGLLRLRILLPGCRSLKEKRSHLKPMLVRVRRAFNVSAAETGLHDVWQSAEVALVTVANDSAHAHRSLMEVLRWIETHHPNLQLEEETYELIQ